MMRRLALVFGWLTILVMSSAVTCDEAARPRAGDDPLSNDVLFMVTIYDDQGHESEEEIVVQVTLAGTGEYDPHTQQNKPVTFTDYETGVAGMPSPYTYYTEAPVEDWQRFPVGVVLVTFTADATILPGWSMKCEAFDIHENKLDGPSPVKNETGLPIEMQCFTVWPSTQTEP